MERFIRIAFIFAVCLAGFKCGVYGFRGNNPTPGINSIAVPTFNDESGFSAPGLADQFTQELKDKIISDNTYRVADVKVADAVLKCTVTNVRDEALVVSAGDNVSKRKVTIAVNVVFENLKTQKNIWTKPFENYGEYNSSNVTESERAKGIDIAVQRVTEDILIDITSNW